MKKKLRLRLSSVISSFQSCRQKTSASALPPVFYLSPSNSKKFDIEFPTPPPPPRPSPTRRLAAVVASTARCRSCAPARMNFSPAVDLGEDDMSVARETPAYLWRKEEKWHVVTASEEVERRRKIDLDDEEEEDGDDLFPAGVRKMAARRRKREMELRRRRRHRKSTSKSRNSTSSLASGSWFSSDEDQDNDEREDTNTTNNCYYYNNDNDDDDDTDTLLSSTDTTSSIAKPRVRCPSSPEHSRSSVLSKLMPCSGRDQGKVKESFAVVKKSEDPRGDFRRSMAEMVVEKGIYNAADLEHLLHCFLSLNSQQQHQAIVAAFADIWEALFPESSPNVLYD